VFCRPVDSLNDGDVVAVTTDVGAATTFPAAIGSCEPQLAAAKANPTIATHRLMQSDRIRLMMVQTSEAAGSFNGDEDRRKQ
jgi:hypothetical protein